MVGERGERPPGEFPPPGGWFRVKVSPFAGSVGYRTGGPGARIAVARRPTDAETWSFVAAVADEPKLRQAFA